MFSVLAVLIVMLAALRTTALLLSGDTNLAFLHERKVALAAQIRAVCGAPASAEPFVVAGATEIKTARCDLRILDNPQFQTFVFNEGILFRPNEDRLNAKGVQVLSLVRRALGRQGSDIVEIQILGHTDTQGGEVRNFELGSARALAVFNLLTRPGSDRIDPLSTLMSVTTYGYFDPVQRRNQPEFSSRALHEANATAAARTLNRRIELNVFFRKAPRQP
ncbi:MAG: OmpA family protein [Pseudomonadota bacterium]